MWPNKLNFLRSLRWWIFFGLPVLGVVIRCKHYIFNGSFWIDEAALALSFTSRNFYNLISTPLDHNQSAPPGFITVSYISGQLFGIYDWSLRFFPFFAGVSAIPLAILLAVKSIRSDLARFTFVGLICFSPVLIYYSSEFKPYSVDATVTIGIMALLAYRDDVHFGWFALVSFVAVVLSSPAVFVLAPACLLLFHESIKRGEFKPLLSIGVGCAIGVALHLFYLKGSGVDTAFMKGWWGPLYSFAPFPPTSLNDVVWYPGKLWETILLAMTQDSVAAPIKPEIGIIGWVSVAVTVGAIIFMVKRRNHIVIVASAVICITLIASAFEFYPFSSRLIIFLVPCVLFVFASSIDELVDAHLARTAVAAVALLLIIPALLAIEFLVRPKYRNDFEGALAVLNDLGKAGQAVIVTEHSWRTYQFYQANVRTEADLIFRFFPSDDNPGALKELIKEKNLQKVWVLVSEHEADSAIKASWPVCIEEYRSNTLLAGVILLSCSPSAAS